MTESKLIANLIRRGESIYLNLTFLLFTLGLLTLNTVLLLSSVVPLTLLLVGLALGLPQVSISRQLSQREARVGDIIELIVRITCTRGVGVITVRLDLPPELALVDGNLQHMLFKGLTELSEELRLKLRCVKSGLVQLPPMQIEIYNILGVRSPKVLSIADELTLRVRPRIYLIKKRSRIAYARPSWVAGSLYARLVGPPTLEFREIRKYVPGDPIRNINWKATARLGSEIPLVNEFERETYRYILLAVENLNKLDFGSPELNVREAALSILFSLALNLLRREQRVYIYCDDTFTRVKRNTLFTILDKMFRSNIELQQVCDKIVDFARRRKHETHIILIVNLDYTNVSQLEDLARRLRRFRHVYLHVLDMDIVEILRRYGYPEDVMLLYELVKRSLRSRLGRYSNVIVRVCKVEAETPQIVITRLLSELV